MVVFDIVATGKRIAELRRERHLKVSDVIERLGLQSEQAYYKWQRGECAPAIENLIGLAFIFGCKVDDILVAREYEKEESESSLLPVNGIISVAQMA